MDEVQNDVINAIDLINGKKCGGSFSKYCTSFLFGTENQSGINSILNYENKDVLTVASSGDQYLGAVYYGANVVDIFDINRFSYYITYLKIVAIMNLEYKEFLGFFVPVNWSNFNNTFFAVHTFKKLFPYMPKDVEYFWKCVITQVKNNSFGSFIIPYQYTNHLDVVQNGMPFYENEKEYNKLKELLNSKAFPNFLEVDLVNLNDSLVGKYDILYLSNIIECMVKDQLKEKYGRSFNLKHEDEVEEEILNKLGPGLISSIKENGIILMSYRPNSNLRFSKDLLYNFEYFKVSKVFSKVSPYDDDYIDQSDVDLVLTYKPSDTGFYFKK